MLLKIHKNKIKEIIKNQSHIKILLYLKNYIKTGKITFFDSFIQEKQNNVFWRNLKSIMTIVKYFIR